MKNLKKITAFALSLAVLCLGFGLLVRTPKTTTAYAADTGYETIDPDAPEVLFTSEITSESLLRIYKALGFDAEGEVAVKMSTGEPPNSNYLRPELIKDLIQEVDGTIVECNTAYGGRRSSTAMHRQVIEDHGFLDVAKAVDIMDENGDITIPVPTPATGARSTITTNRVGAHLTNYDSLISLAHFKGHAMAGYGGAIKNMSIGIGSVAGKCLIHTGGRSSTSPWGGNQNAFLESMGDATSSVVNQFDGKVVYINVMNRLSIDCDCDGNPSEPDMHDIGILASYDPVALDQACLDLISQADGNTRFLNRVNGQNGFHTLEHAQEIGLGSRSYRIRDIDAEPVAVTMSYDNGRLTVSGLDGEAALIRVSYSDGALAGVDISSVTNGTRNMEVNGGDKLFLWNSLMSMQPLCPSVTVPDGGPKTLVVYYSATNTTEGVAEKIAAYTGADIFEITPSEPYTDDDLDWTDNNSRVVAEHNDPDGRHVELETTDVPDWASYDTVYIGAPIWWGEFSWVIDDFVKNNDFAGKTVIPFCTSMSSGLGDSGRHVAEMASSGNWLDGKRFGTRASEKEIQEWVDSLGLN